MGIFCSAVPYIASFRKDLSHTKVASAGVCTCPACRYCSGWGNCEVELHLDLSATNILPPNVPLGRHWELNALEMPVGWIKVRKMWFSHQILPTCRERHQYSVWADNRFKRCSIISAAKRQHRQIIPCVLLWNRNYIVPKGSVEIELWALCFMKSCDTWRSVNQKFLFFSLLFFHTYLRK